MEINNKLESINAIRELNLNKFPEELFESGEEDRVIMFLNKYKAPYYAIRDKSSPSGVFKLMVDYNRVLEEVKEYKIFTINVSSINYSDNQLLVGEIEIKSNNKVYAVLSTNPKFSVRDAIQKPEINIKTTLFDDNTLNKIPYFDYIYNYIVTHKLKDIIVEFALFDKNVGINNERVIIYELRTNY
ncbi:MAG: hypothetical protein J5982_04835 [Bacilli bacterium]|nr:hypothetical protein [Bacilli bacterium]